jgi:hypothetical protein
MDEFFVEMQRLRDSVEDKRVYDTLSMDNWNTLCASMDALEDTHHAILAFVTAASKKLEPKLQKRELGERYLRTYGVMQAFAIQQDAIVNLNVSLGMPEPDLKPLQRVRDFRIAAAGHPTLQDRPKTLPRRAHFISQMTLGDSGNGVAHNGCVRATCVPSRPNTKLGCRTGEIRLRLDSPSGGAPDLAQSLSNVR